MSGCYANMSSFEFGRREIDEAVREDKLLSIEIEFTRQCNFNCPYCYTKNGDFLNGELTPDEIRDVVLQAKEMGAKRIIILGGEPMVYPKLMDMIEFISREGLRVDMFTNGFQITPEIAGQLFANRTNIVLKLNSFNENIQDMLAGHKGASKIIWDAFHNLRSAGYPSKEAFLALSTVLCRQNIDEIVPMWRWMRDENIIPYFEIITPQGAAKQNEWLDVDIRKIHSIFNEIAKLDREKYGYDWEPQPPLIGNKCLRHQYSCLITSKGYVMPCVGVTIPVGDIRQRRLKDILKDSEVVSDLRHFRHTIKGPCATCKKSEECYGCRGSAYQLTGDYLASDPLCWHNADRGNEIKYMPVPVDGLIPHQYPMRIIDSLVRVVERSVDVAVTVKKEMPFVSSNGVLDEVAYLEMMAQAAATMHGFKQTGTKRQAEKGFLLGCKKFEILGQARVGDLLEISVYKLAKYAEFGILKGTVSRDNDLLARGELKIWHSATSKKILEEVPL